VLAEEDLRSTRRLRWRLPLALFVATCFSTFWAGVNDWPMLSGGQVGFRRLILHQWDQGLIYMGCLLAILLTHEMGHFLTTLYYRIPSSLPYFIPFPFSPIGTMGAVIGMDGQRANRREIFDIGLAGPVAGLIIAIPILWLGIERLDEHATYGTEIYDCPLLIEWMAHRMHPDRPIMHQVYGGQLNPYFMAGWVGLLITGVNMMPVSQLDGGHVIYGLFGRRSHWLARGFILTAIAFCVLFDALLWTPMLILVILMGTDHPRTADDSVVIGPVRTVLGFLSLLIPILCFPAYGVHSATGW
jgi:membrane-associated protease RseP (regulator of RpoE activity)